MSDYLIRSETLDGIANAIQEKTGKTEQIKAEDMAALVGEVFESGRNDAHAVAWNAIQQNGERKNWSFAFYGSTWNESNFRPIYDIVVVSASESMFNTNGIGDLKNHLLSLGIRLDFSQAQTLSNTFAYSKITNIPVLDFSAATKIVQVFDTARSLVTVEKMTVTTQAVFNNAFRSADSLENIIIEGTIGQNGFDVKWSPLTHDSLMSIINALADYSNSTSTETRTLTIGETNRAKLTDDELAIAEMKGWEVA